MISPCYDVCVQHFDFVVDMPKPAMSILRMVLCASCCNTFISISTASFTLLLYDNIYSTIAHFKFPFYYNFIFEHFKFFLIPLHFAMIHFTLAIHSIQDSIQRSNAVMLKSDLNCTLIALHVFALCDIDLHPHIMILIRAYFTFYLLLSIQLQ